MPLFVPDPSIIVAFAIASIILAITPGPDMAVFISRTVNYGRPHGTMTVLGAISGLLVHTSLAAFGVSFLLANAPTAFLVLKIAGAAYLLWLAYSAIRSSDGITFIGREKRQPSLLQSYLTGIGINLTNPKIILFFVTFLPQFVSSHDPNAAGKLLFLSAEFLIVSLPVVFAVVVMAEWVKNILTRSKLAQKALNWSFAAIFAGFAAAIITVEGQH